jgi:hypothetical protein
MVLVYINTQLRTAAKDGHRYNQVQSVMTASSNPLEGSQVVQLMRAHGHDALGIYWSERSTWRKRELRGFHGER